PAQTCRPILARTARAAFRQRPRRGFHTCGSRRRQIRPGRTHRRLALHPVERRQLRALRREKRPRRNARPFQRPATGYSNQGTTNSPQTRRTVRWSERYFVGSWHGYSIKAGGRSWAVTVVDHKSSIHPDLVGGYGDPAEQVSAGKQAARSAGVAGDEN